MTLIDIMGIECIYSETKEVLFSELKGKYLISVERRETEDMGDALIFTTRENEIYVLYHEQSCCEDVFIEDVCGDFDDLIGTAVLFAEERSSECNLDHSITEIDGNDVREKLISLLPNNHSFTWTFYIIATIKGTVHIRWYGKSNGFYSEKVSFIKKRRSNNSF